MEIKTPTLLVDRLKVRANIEKMLNKTGSNIIFRPHFKTHQSAEIAELFREVGISKITVSSLSMANYFSQYGWMDITIAFPLNILEMNDIVDLAKKISLNVLIESSCTAEKLVDSIDSPMGVFIKIDTGYNRTGLSFNDDEIDNILHTISNNNNVIFKGFITHAGHTYNIKGREEIIRIMVEGEAILAKLKTKYLKQYPDIIISWGDTPSCSIANGFDGFDEVRPGNFAYFDVMQYHLGSCSLDEIAVAVACPVVALHPERNEIVIYGGGVHLSKEFIDADNDFKLYGYVVNIIENGWSDPIPGAYVSSLSQEHGIIKVLPETVKKINIGDLIGVIPIHSCMTANLLRDKTRIIN